MNTKHKTDAWIHHRTFDPVIGFPYSRIPLDALTDLGVELDRWINEGGAVERRLAIESMPPARDYVRYINNGDRK